METGHRIVAAMIALAGIAAAQSTKAGLLGVVRDPAGLPVRGARIEAVHENSGAHAELASSADGSYQFLALQPGTYRVSVHKEGFAGLNSVVHVCAGGRVSLDLNLTLGDSGQSAEVTATAPLLESTRGTVSFVVDQRQTATLPLDGRNFVPLIALSPGVNLPPGSVLPRINGGRPRVSEYIYDGVSVLQPEPGQVAFYPIVDAIEEFRIETNSYPAEYGRANGGVIVVNQKSGTNQWHGTLFEFFRHERLNARNLFAAAGPKPRFRRNQAGFVVGGPVQKNRTFLFGDWQSTRLQTGAVRTSSVPTPLQQRGVFAVPIFDPASTRQTGGVYQRDPFPNGEIPANRVDAAARAVVNRYPEPNLPSSTGANNYRRMGTEDTSADQWDGRIDAHPSPRHRLFARFSYLRDHNTPAAPLPDGSGSLTSGVIGDTQTRARGLAVEHTWNLTPGSVNQMRFGYTARAFDRQAMRIGAGTSIPNLPVSSFPDVLPVYDVVGLQQLGPPPGSNAVFSTSVVQWIDNLSFTRGRHTWKIGADFRLQSLNVLQPANPTGNFQFTGIFTTRLTPQGAIAASTGSSFASFLLGQVSRFSLDAQPEIIRPRARIAESFLQDDWRVSRRLTLNLGVRYTLNFPSTVAGDRGAVFNLEAQRLDLLGANGAPRTARNLENANFGPRAGLALKIAETLVLRAGYGMTWIEQAGITTPFTTPLFPFIQTLTQQTLDNINPAFQLSQGPSVRPQSPNAGAGLGQGVFGVQRDNGSGYAQQWNLTFQQTFGENWSLETGYLGSKLTRLGVPDVNLNQLSVEQLGLGPELTQQVDNPYFRQLPAGGPLATRTIARGQLLRPYPRFTAVSLYRNNTGHSTYHSLQARLEKRFAQRLTFTAAYTFSRVIDDAGAVFDSAVLAGPVVNFQAADSFNKRLEKDVSTGNMPHVFASAFVCELPWGWRLGGIARLQSGSPLAVTQATNLNAFAGFGIQRPNRVRDAKLPGSSQSKQRWFDTAAFSTAGQFTIGDSSRNPVSGPGYRTFDLMLGKTLPITERLRMELRAEAFNLTNTPPLAAPNTSFGSPAFGSITSALDPRVFELVVKLQF